MEIIFLIIGLFFGSAFTYFILKGRKVAVNSEVPQARIEDLLLQVKEWKTKCEQEVEKKEMFITQLATKTANCENLEAKLNEQAQYIEGVQTKFTTEFKLLANEILEEKSKKFTEQNKINIDTILAPLSEKIKGFEQRVIDTYDKEAKERFSLQNEVKNLFDLSKTISQEANNLTNALKGQAKTQGNWGEMVLESILEKSGLVKDREYFVQKSYNDSEGSRFQPDVVVNYPANKSIVIDSKVSLNAYERYANEENKEQQKIELKSHIDALKFHIVTLSSKNYQDLYSLTSLDFVLMFVPIEPAFMVAVQHDQDLWSYAYERKILLISPTNLIATLKIISSLWRQEYQNRNALEIAKQSGDLYDKFVGLLEDLVDFGRKLKGTTESYEGAMNKLSTGKGNVIKRIEDIKILGAKASKSLPQVLIDRSEN